MDREEDKKLGGLDYSIEGCPLMRLKEQTGDRSSLTNSINMAAKNQHELDGT